MDNSPETSLTDQERDVLTGNSRLPETTPSPAASPAAGSDSSESLGQAESNRKNQDRLDAAPSGARTPETVFVPEASQPGKARSPLQTPTPAHSGDAPVHFRNASAARPSKSAPYSFVRPRFISQHELLELRTLLDKTAAALEQDWGTKLRDRIRISIRQIQSGLWSDLFSAFGIELYSWADASTATDASSCNAPGANNPISSASANKRLLRFDIPGAHSVERNQDPPNWQVSWLSSKELTWCAPLIFSSSLLSNIFDRLLGGSDDPHWDNRLGFPLTALELKLFSKTAESFCDIWRQSWSEIIPLTFDPVACCNHLRLDSRNSLDPQDPIAICEFSLVWKGMEQPLYLALPYYSLDNIQRQMARARCALLNQTSFPPLETIHPGIRRARVRLSAELARTTMTAGEFTQIRIGDILTTDQPIDAPITVLIEGSPKFQAHIGQYQGCKAIQIDKTTS